MFQQETIIVHVVHPVLTLIKFEKMFLSIKTCFDISLLFK